MENYRQTLETLMDQAWKDEQVLIKSFSQYTEPTRSELKAKEKFRIVQKHIAAMKMFLLKLKTKLEDLKIELREKRFPGLSSSFDANKLRAEVAINSSLLIEEKFPVKVLNDAYELKRIDFAISLEERREGIESSDIHEAEQEQKFNETKELWHEKLGITETEKQIKEVEEVSLMAEKLKGVIEANISILNATDFQSWATKVEALGFTDVTKPAVS